MPIAGANNPAPGDTLAGKYELVRLLGEGGMASVFQGVHVRLGQPVAVKILAPAMARDPELVARFEREARAVARLKTRHAVRVMDVDVTDRGVPFMVMELLDGRDVEEELEVRQRLPVGEAVDIVVQAATAMEEAHAIGIVHRDLKPANLFLVQEGPNRIVKVIDFGISKFVGEATRLTGAGAVMGTVLYMSPEQVRAQSDVDTRADIWSLGVILFELVAGRAPWEGSSPQIATSIVSRDAPDLRSYAQVPDGVADVVRTMMQRDKTRRFASMRDVVLALARFAPKGSVGADVAEDAYVEHTNTRLQRQALMASNVSAGGTLLLPGGPQPGAPQAGGLPAGGLSVGLPAGGAPMPPGGGMPPPSYPSGYPQSARPSIPSGPLAGGSMAPPPAPRSGNTSLLIAAVFGVLAAVVLLAIVLVAVRRIPGGAGGRGADAGAVEAPSR